MLRLVRSPLLSLALLGLAAGPASAVTSGFVELSYNTPTRSDAADAFGGGPPEEGDPPLPLDVTLTTPIPDTPGEDDAFIGLHGQVLAEVPSGPGVFVQSVGAGVGGVDFESPFGGTIENTILWSDDPVGDGPFDISARASVTQEIRYQVVAQAISVSFAWSGDLLFYANNFGTSGEYEYGYSLTASIFSKVEDGFYATFPEIGALGGPGLTVQRDSTSNPPNEDFIFDSETLSIPFIGPADVGNFFRVELALEVWIEGSGFDVGQYALIQNTADFTGTLGVTSIDGAVMAPEPGVPALGVAGFLAWLTVLRRRGSTA